MSQAVPAEASSPDEMRSPVDDRTYNLLQALTSTLEAIDAYELYASEDGQAALFEGLLLDERRHAEILVDELRMSLESLVDTRRGDVTSASTTDVGSSAAS